MTWTVQSIRPLLEQWDEQVRGRVGRFDRVVPEIEASDSVLREPANDEEVAAAEERLGVQLPPSYRSFLLISNGAYASSLGAEEAGANDPHHGFVQVGDVAPAAEADAGLVKLWTGDPDLNDPANDRTPGVSSVEVSYFRPVEDALLVSKPTEGFRDLLVPRKGEKEWEFWSFHGSGATAHRSFAHWLESELASPAIGPEPSQADKFIAEVRAGDLYKLELLAELGDPRTGDIACEVLEDGDAPRGLGLSPPLRERERAGRAGRVLGLLGEPRFVPVLRKAYDSATMLDTRRATLKALVLCGAPDARELLADTAQNEPDETFRRWASQTLDELD